MRVLLPPVDDQDDTQVDNQLSAGRSGPSRATAPRSGNIAKGSVNRQRRSAAPQEDVETTGMDLLMPSLGVLQGSAMQLPNIQDEVPLTAKESGSDETKILLPSLSPKGTFPGQRRLPTKDKSEDVQFMVGGQDLKLPPPKLPTESRKKSQLADIVNELGAVLQRKVSIGDADTPMGEMSEALRRILLCHAFGIPVQITEGNKQRADQAARPVFHCQRCLAQWNASGTIPPRCDRPAQPVHGEKITIPDQATRFIEQLQKSQLRLDGSQGGEDVKGQEAAKLQALFQDLMETNPLSPPEDATNCDSASSSCSEGQQRGIVTGFDLQELIGEAKSKKKASTKGKKHRATSKNKSDVFSDTSSKSHVGDIMKKSLENISKTQTSEQKQFSRESLNFGLKASEGDIYRDIQSELAPAGSWDVMGGGVSTPSSPDSVMDLLRNSSPQVWKKQKTKGKKSKKNKPALTKSGNVADPSSNSSCHTTTSHTDEWGGTTGGDRKKKKKKQRRSSLFDDNSDPMSDSYTFLGSLNSSTTSGEGDGMGFSGGKRKRKKKSSRLHNSSDSDDVTQTGRFPDIDAKLKTSKNTKSKRIKKNEKDGSAKLDKLPDIGTAYGSSHLSDDDLLSDSSHKDRTTGGQKKKRNKPSRSEEKDGANDAKLFDKGERKSRKGSILGIWDEGLFDNSDPDEDFLLQDDNHKDSYDDILGTFMQDDDDGKNEDPKPAPGSNYEDDIKLDLDQDYLASIDAEYPWESNSTEKATNDTYLDDSLIPLSPSGSGSLEDKGQSKGEGQQEGQGLQEGQSYQDGKYISSRQEEDFKMVAMEATTKKEEIFNSHADKYARGQKNDEIPRKPSIPGDINATQDPGKSTGKQKPTMLKKLEKPIAPNQNENQAIPLRKRKDQVKMPKLNKAVKNKTGRPDTMPGQLHGHVSTNKDSSVLSSVTQRPSAVKKTESKTGAHNPRMSARRISNFLLDDLDSHQPFLEAELEARQEGGIGVRVPQASIPNRMLSTKPQTGKERKKPNAKVQRSQQHLVLSDKGPPHKGEETEMYTDKTTSRGRGQQERPSTTTSRLSRNTETQEQTQPHPNTNRGMLKMKKGSNPPNMPRQDPLTAPGHTPTAPLPPIKKASTVSTLPSDTALNDSAQKPVCAVKPMQAEETAADCQEIVKQSEEEMIIDDDDLLEPNVGSGSSSDCDSSSISSSSDEGGVLSTDNSKQQPVTILAMKGVSSLSFTPAFSFSIYKLPDQHRKHNQQIQTGAAEKKKVQKKKKPNPVQKPKESTAPKDKPKSTSLSKLSKQIAKKIQNKKAFKNMVRELDTVIEEADSHGDASIREKITSTSSAKVETEVPEVRLLPPGVDAENAENVEVEVTAQSQVQAALTDSQRETIEGEYGDNVNIDDTMSLFNLHSDPSSFRGLHCGESVIISINTYQ